MHACVVHFSEEFLNRNTYIGTYESRFHTYIGILQCDECHFKKSLASSGTAKRVGSLRSCMHNVSGNYNVYLKTFSKRPNTALINPIWNLLLSRGFRYIMRGSYLSRPAITLLYKSV